MFFRVEYREKVTCPRLSNHWYVQKEVIPVQFVREVLLNIKGQQSGAISVEEKMTWGVLGIRLEWSETISMSYTDAPTRLYTPTQHRRGRRTEDRGRKNRWRSGSVPAQQSGLWAFSPLRLFKLTIFSKCYPQRREVVGLKRLQINRYSHIHRQTAESQTTGVKKKLVLWDRNELRQIKSLLLSDRFNHTPHFLSRCH